MPEAEIHLLDAYEYIYMYSDEDVNTKRRNDMEDGKWQKRQQVTARALQLCRKTEIHLLSGG